MSNVTRAIERFEAMVGEIVEAVAIGRRQGRGDLDLQEPVEPMPGDEALAFLDYGYDGAMGSLDPPHPVYAWTRSWVLFLSGEEGAAELTWIPRHPRRCVPEKRRELVGRWTLQLEGSVAVSADDDGAALARIRRLQVEITARDMSNLVAADDTADLAWSVALAFRTLDALPHDERVPFWLKATHGLGGPVQALLLLDLPDELRDEWRGWLARYQALVARNPRLELADLIGLIGETIDHSNWPTVPAAALRAWVDGGERLPLPWAACEFDEISIDRPFYDRLRELRVATGGWVVWDAVAAMRVFVPDETIGTGSYPDG